MKKGWIEDFEYEVILKMIVKDDFLNKLRNQMLQIESLPSLQIHLNLDQFLKFLLLLVH